MENIPIIPFSNFQDAAKAVVKTLHARYGFNLWMVTHTLVDDWIVLAADDHGYDVSAGDVFNWSDSFCSRMVKNMGPRIASNSSQIEAYSKAPIAQKLNISSYIGVPISISDGSLFGTLCAIDPNPQPLEMENELQFIELQAQLLSSILDMETRIKNTERYVNQIQADSPVDMVSGLLNTRGWSHAIHTEEKRHIHLGQSASVAIFEIDTDNLALTDDIAKLVATALRTSFRPFDTIARLQDKTFGIIISELGESSDHLFNRAKINLEKLKLDIKMGSAKTSAEQDLDTAISVALSTANRE